MLKEIEEKLRNVTLEGGNLVPVKNLSFKLITKSGNFELTPEQSRIISTWEEMYFKLFERMKNKEFPVEPIKIEDGKVEIAVGHPFHRANASINTLHGISVAGLVASEWYGILECEGEAYFCTFLDTLQEELPYKEFGRFPNKEEREYLRKYLCAKKNHNAAFSKDCMRKVTLFFDGNNQVMKELINIDFFQYLKVRKEHPEKLEQIYDKNVIELFEEVCDAQNMDFSATFHDENDYERKSWLAIPMGIPPMLINGICINSVESPDLLEKINEIAEMFPNAVIFNENKEVLHYPLVNEEKPKSL